MNIELRQDQIDAIKKLASGKILCGGVGSGKSRTSLAYYFFCVCGGRMKVNGKGDVKIMSRPRDLYIITTAMKRDKHEWEDECASFGICKDPSISFSGVKMTVDSWQNIKKYTNVENAFFIFDEQKLSGYGPWAKAFIEISRHNRWIVLSATPGDVWMDYMTIFIANGLFKNKTDFVRHHVVYRANVTFPVVDHYVDEEILERYRSLILVKMNYTHDIKTKHTDVQCNWDNKRYSKVMKERYNPETEEPFDTISALLYYVRRIVNNDESRYERVKMLMGIHSKAIVFYNFDYELEKLRGLGEDLGIEVAEWNGHVHQPVPTSSKWVYLVQYNSGAEGWNCITTDTVIFYSQNYSYKIMTQSAGRINRFNTPFDTLYYYHLKSAAPIDKAIAKALANKKTFNETAFMSKSA